MRIFLILILICFLSSCTTVKVAKEVNKATGSIRASVNQLINKNEDTGNGNIEIKKGQEDIKVKKIKEKKIIKEQTKIIEIKFLGRTFNEIEYMLGKASLVRDDGNTKMARFNGIQCRFFIFFDNTLNYPKVEYFELRDQSGQLIKTKEKTQSCLKELIKS